LTKQKDVKDKRAAGLPQRGQIDSLDWSNFDEYMQVCTDHTWRLTVLF